MDKKDFVVARKIVFEYIENHNDSCDGCDLKGCRECNSGNVDCIGDDGKFYILKLKRMINKDGFDNRDSIL